MVQHWKKGFSRKKDPTGIIHSLNARGIKTGRTKRLSKYKTRQLMDFAAMRRAQTQRGAISDIDIPPIEPVPGIPSVQPPQAIEPEPAPSVQLTPPKEKATTFSFAQPEGGGEEPSLPSFIPESIDESRSAVVSPPEPPHLGEF